MRAEKNLIEDIRARAAAHSRRSEGAGQPVNATQPGRSPTRPMLEVLDAGGVCVARLALLGLPARHVLEAMEEEVAARENEDTEACGEVTEETGQVAAVVRLALSIRRALA